jgi:multidrug efflux pump subunit AcrB
VERELRTIPGIGNVTSSASLVRPELVVRPDFARAADLGVTTAAIADTLRIATAGDYDQGLAKLNLASARCRWWCACPPTRRADLDLLSRLPVPGAHGPVPCQRRHARTWTAARRRSTATTACATSTSRSSSTASRWARSRSGAGAAQPAQAAAGVIQTTVGDAEAMGELFASFGLAMLTGVLCIYIVLVLLFKDFVQPVTILGALVLSVPGAFLALFVTARRSPCRR